MLIWPILLSILYVWANKTSLTAATSEQQLWRLLLNCCQLRVKVNAMHHRQVTMFNWNSQLEFQTIPHSKHKLHLTAAMSSLCVCARILTSCSPKSFVFFFLLRCQFHAAAQLKRLDYMKCHEMKCKHVITELSDSAGSLPAS